MVPSSRSGRTTTGPGYAQGVKFADTAAACGFVVWMVDPLKLDPAAPEKYDSRDWRPGTGPPRRAQGGSRGGRAALRERIPARTAPSSVNVDNPYSVAGVEAMLTACGLEHRHNERAGRAEVRENGGRWGERSDEWMAHFRQQLPERCSRLDKDGDAVPVTMPRAALADAMLAHAHVNRIDPFLEWVETLPAWDGVTRPWLSDCFPSLADNALAAWASLAVPLTAVRRAFDPGVKADEMTVLAGAQGIGKSTAAAWLFPEDMRREWFVDNVSFRAPQKDRAEAIARAVCVEFAELAGLKRTEVEGLKAFLSSADDGSARFAFRRDATSRPRRAVFLGTTNGDDFLPADPTGNRRFVVLPVGEVDHRHAAHVRAYLDANRAQVWAEALARHRGGEPHHLPHALKGEAAAVNEGYRARDEATEAVVLAYADIPGNEPVEFSALRAYAHRSGERVCRRPMELYCWRSRC